MYTNTRNSDNSQASLSSGFNPLCSGSNNKRVVFSTAKLAVGGKLSRHFVPADGTGAVQCEPGQDTIRMVKVLARHFPDLSTDGESFHTNGTRKVIGEQAVGVDGEGRHGIDGRLRSRRGSMALKAGLSKLLEEEIQAGAKQEIVNVEG